MRTISFLKKKWQILSLFFLWLFSTALQFIWLKLDRAPASGNWIEFILRGMRFEELYDRAGFLRTIKKAFEYSEYPPLVDFTYFLYYRLFGISSEMELMVSCVYLGIGIIGVYGIGKFLFNKNTGLLGGLVFVSLPAVISFSKAGFSEFYSMCFLAPAVYFLLKAEYFKNRKFSILFGVSSGLLMLVKWENFLFLIAPLSFMGARIIFDKDFHRNLFRAGNFVLALLAASLISFPWYIVNWHKLVNGISSRAEDAIYFSIKDSGFYLNHLGSGLLTKFYIFLAVIICGYSLIKRLILKAETKYVKNLLLLCFYFALPLLIFSFLHPKHCPHIIPLLVFVSLILAGGYNFIRIRAVKFIFIYLTVFHALNIQLMPFQRMFPDKKTINWAREISPLDNFQHRFSHNIGYLYGALPEITRDDWDFKFKEILRFIKEDYNTLARGRNNKRASVLVLGNEGFLKFPQFEYYNIKDASPLSLIEITSRDSSRAREKIKSRGYEYILLKKPIRFSKLKRRPENASLIKAIEFINDSKEFTRNYYLLKEFELPDSLKIAVYKKTKGGRG